MASTATVLDTLVDALDAEAISFQAEFFGGLTVALPDGTTLCLTEDIEGIEIRRYFSWSDSDEGVEVAFDVPAFEAVRIVALAIAGTEV